MGRSTHISLIWHLFFSLCIALSSFVCLPSPSLLLFQHHSLLYILRYISSFGRNGRSTEPCRIILCRCTEFNTENNQDSPLPVLSGSDTFFTYLSCFRFRLLLYHSVCSTERIILFYFIFFFTFLFFFSIRAELIPFAMCLSPPSARFPISLFPSLCATFPICIFFLPFLLNNSPPFKWCSV
ncbi:hypothetical protein BDV26DRAFT_90714 [Aspergillus bertholletiae]|uniref:Uncharacterized protein n=1 Tax=Aspergillus bertholletiae TaxID=1226010 RepID=A0A5N7ARX7_9EURO|nr:hypothetical protein BDV26DRAFT_90714 [Aspergillus bertholletiae]